MDLDEAREHKKIYLITGDDSDTPAIKEEIDKKGFQLLSDTHDADVVRRIATAHPDLIVYTARHFDYDALHFCDTINSHISATFTPFVVLVSQNGEILDSELEQRPGLKVMKRPAGREGLATLLDEYLGSTIAIKFWGVRGSTPCANKENMEYGGNTTCFEVKLPGNDEILILDSGTGIRNLGNHLEKTQENIRGRIFITHPHWDHIQGFPFFKPIYNRENHFDIHMPPQVNGGCKEILSGHLTKTFFPVTLEMIDANIEYITQKEELQSYNGYKMEYMLANHPINTAIYKIYVGNKKIVFCPDNELTPISEKTNAYFYKKLKEFFYEADVLIHDSQYNLNLYDTRRGWGHSAWEEAVDFAAKSKVKNLFLTHHDPDSNDSYLEALDTRLRRDFGSKFESIQLAKEGLQVHISTRDGGSFEF